MKRKDFLLILCLYPDIHFPIISIHAADSIVNAGIDDLLSRLSAGDSIAMDTDSLDRGISRCCVAEDLF